MRLTSARLGLVFTALLALSGCEFLTGGGGGGGGGTGGGSGSDFTRGIVHVRKDDRNLYIADDRAYSTVSQLTEGGGAYTPSLSRDGRVVVFIARSSSDSTIATIPARGGSVSAVLQSTSSIRNLRTPVFSPDGTKIVFAYDEGASSVIGIVNVDGSGFEKVAGGAISYGSPSFMPDGTVLVSAGNLASGFNQIERLDLSTRMASNVVSNLGNEVQAISNRVVASPDGRFATFDGRIGSGASRIFVLNLGTLALTQLTDYPSEPNAIDSYPAWVGSANIAFSSTTGGADQVYVLAADSVKTSGGLTLPKAIEPFYGPN